MRITPLLRRPTLVACALALAALAAPAAAGPVPASPQPSAGALKPGLAVAYAYPGDVRFLREAERQRGWAEPGPAIVGFDYPDSEPGAPALTSTSPERVVAFIDGYMHFETAGDWRMEFWSNDGLRVTLGGAEIYKSDGRHPCDTEGWTTVSIPEPGWYEVEALFYQRLNTSCLMLKWQPPGGAEEWTPVDGVYGHR